jgi:hypothetical protein
MSASVAAAASSWNQGWKKNRFKKKTSPVGFLEFFGFFGGFLERVFKVFSVSRILLGASRL